MSVEHKKNFTDRLQFLGVIGPFVVLLTLFSVLLKGSATGWYLFFATLLGLPLSWKWQTKGFLASLGILTLLLMCMYPFLDHSEKLWQIGASISLGIGLFVTFLGFEEIKEIIMDLQLESQSRLDNLIELDDQIKRSQKDWDLSEEDYLSKIADKDQTITKLSDQADSLEKSTYIMHQELKELQGANQRHIDELEKRFTEYSKMEINQLKMSQELEKVNGELSLSLSDREKIYCDENLQLTKQLDDFKALVFELEEKLEAHTEYESNLSQEASENQLNVKKMQETLREKVSKIYDLQDRLNVRENDVIQQKSELEALRKQIETKEHEVLTIKAQIQERDRKINEISQKLRDLDQDLNIARSKIEEQKNELKEITSKQEELQFSQESKIKTRNLEVEALHKELEEKGLQLKKLILRNNEVDHTIEMYEQRVIELQEEIDEKAKNHHKELTALNEARFALFQADLDKERIKKELVNQKEEPPIERPTNKHWLVQLQSILKQTKYRKVELENLPKDLRQEIVTLNQSKALYSQLRAQFEDKNKVLEEVREKLFKAESQLEKLKKQRENDLVQDSVLENELEKSLFIKDQEIKSVEDEVESLNLIVSELLLELEHEKQA
ncbi:MAG: Chromosome partition protein Smc [Chlamydiae bacterium]|nr:Chromosome partition protein Smc [Chlamydiota bacterium]